jgi:predicted CXXCH cytochrome family protein
VHAGDEAHPIGRTMSERLADPGWPTVNRTVQCLTCHDVKQQCDAAAERPEANAAFLRQVNGGTTPFCQSCHREEQTPKFNPHRMLEDDLHTPIEARCQVCHDKQLDTKGGVRTGDASLRADQVTLCRSCHPRHRDISPVGHVLAKIEPGMLTYMRAREITGLLNTPGQDLLTQLAAQGAQPTLMVPDGQGRVVCSTCHNPHERGTFAPGTVLDDRSLRLMKGRLVTPVRGELFCRHCHNL